MSSESITIEQNPFERTVSDLKQGVASATQAHAEATEKAVQTAKDLAAFNQGSIEAFAEASRILATGSQDLFRAMVASGRAAVGESLSGFRSLAISTSIKERLELQASLARASATWAVTESARFAQSSIDLASKASVPLVARTVLAGETFMTIKL